MSIFDGMSPELRAKAKKETEAYGPNNYELLQIVCAGINQFAQAMIVQNNPKVTQAEFSAKMSEFVQEILLRGKNFCEVNSAQDAEEVVTLTKTEFLLKEEPSKSIADPIPPDLSTEARYAVLLSRMTQIYGEKHTLTMRLVGLECLAAGLNLSQHMIYMPFHDSRLNEITAIVFACQLQHLNETEKAAVKRLITALQPKINASNRQTVSIEPITNG